MSFQLSDTSIRAALHTDMLSAWSVTKIYDSKPFLPDTSENLPLGFIYLQSVNPSGGPAVHDVSAPHSYLLHGIFALSAVPSNTTSEEYKVTKAQALLDLLTVQITYAGWMRMITSVDFTDDSLSETDQVITVSIGFDVFALTNY